MPYQVDMLVPWRVIHPTNKTPFESMIFQTSPIGGLFVMVSWRLLLNIDIPDPLKIAPSL